MAIYHLSVKTVSRSAGRSATAAAAYRAGVEIADVRTGEVHDYTRRSGVESATLVLPSVVPLWAADRAALWNAAEQAETRKNSTVAREFEVALPAELPAAERARLALDFARELVARHGCVADVAIHAPGREGDHRNHHAHILLSTRRLGPEGFGEKTRELDDAKTGPALVREWRERFANLTNERLREAGIEARVDHRSLEAQGIDRAPTVHLGPQATGYERRTGQPSRRKIEQQRQAAEQAAAVEVTKALDAEAKAVSKEITQIEVAIEAVNRKQAAEREKAAEQAAPAAAIREKAAKVAAQYADLDPAKVPAAVIARAKATQSAERARAAKTQLLRLDGEESAYRKARPVRTWLHDAGLWRSAALAGYAGQRAALGATVTEAERMAVEAQGEAQRAAQAADTPEVRAERARLHAEHVRLEALAKAKDAQEKARERDVQDAYALMPDFRAVAKGARPGGLPDWLRQEAEQYQKLNDPLTRTNFEKALVQRLADDPQKLDSLRKATRETRQERGHGGPSR